MRERIPYHAALDEDPLTVVGLADGDDQVFHRGLASELVLPSAHLDAFFGREEVRYAADLAIGQYHLRDDSTYDAVE